MTSSNKIFSSSYVDSYGNQLVWDDTIKNIVYYSTEAEVWDKYGGGTHSWYVENELPNDSFYGDSLSSSRWSYFNYRGTTSGTVSNKLRLDVAGSDARGGITSENKWSVSGDFDIRLYLSEDSYYNEYRGESATGLTVSIDDSNKFRVAKYYNGTSIGYIEQFVEGIPLRYFTWRDNGQLYEGANTNDTTCLRIVRQGNDLNGYVSVGSEFISVGSGVSASVWGQEANIEIEVETEQFNTYGMDILGFTISGSLSEPTVFSSPIRGPKQEFPNSSLIVVDKYGMSVVDEEDMTLWMRFVHSEDLMFKDSDAQISASNGKIYFTTSSGLYCIDFVNDRASLYVDGLEKRTRLGIVARNYCNDFYSVGENGFVMHHDVLDVASNVVDGNDFVAAATVSGIGLLINSLDVKTGPSHRVQLVDITSAGHLFWNNFDTDTGTGKLYYRDTLQNLVTDPSSSFSYTGYYDSTTTPVSLSSEEINTVSVSTDTSSRFVTGHSFGIDYVGDFTRVTYGPVNIYNPISDPSFEETVGLYWRLASYSASAGTASTVVSRLETNFNVSSMFPVFNVYRTSDWSSYGGTSLRLTLFSSGYVGIGDWGGVYQQINLTSTDKLYFDIKLDNTSTSKSTNYIDLEIVINDTVLAIFNDSSEPYVRYNNSVDVSTFSGACVLIIRIKSKYSGVCLSNNSFFVDNLRVIQDTPDYAIIPSRTHSVLETMLIFGADKKIFFSTQDGYGAIDVDTNSLDFFTPIDDVLPLSSVISAEYVETIDEV